MKPMDGCKSSSDACQPNSPSRVGKPNMIFGFLVVKVADDAVDVVVVLLFRFLVFSATNHGTKERYGKRRRFVNGFIDSHIST
jgi:hypothetical protein